MFWAKLGLVVYELKKPKANITVYFTCSCAYILIPEELGKGMAENGRIFIPFPYVYSYILEALM